MTITKFELVDALSSRLIISNQEATATVESVLDNNKADIGFRARDYDQRFREIVCEGKEGEEGRIRCASKFGQFSCKDRGHYLKMP